MNNVDLQHKKLIERILLQGSDKRDRTGVGTKSVFGHWVEYDLKEGFPLLTLRKIHTKSVIHEMLWFLGAYDQEKWGEFGNTNIRYLLDNGVTFWTEWPYKKYLQARQYRDSLPEFTIKEFEAKIMIDDAFAKEFGSIGPGYGKQWLNYGGYVERKISEGVNNIATIQNLIIHQGVNQIDYIINLLKKDPDSRRIMLNAWKPDEIDDMLLPPCHYGFQVYTRKMTPSERYEEYIQWCDEKNIPITPIVDFPERKISLKLEIRSNDVGLGNPFNVAEYALLLHMFGQVVNMIPEKLIVDIGDAHIYNNHIEALKEVISRESYDLPKLKLNENIKSIYDFRYEDIIIEKYKAHPNIKMEVAV